MRIFWPLYLVIALAGAVAVWFGAPAFRDGVSESLRSSWANGVATLKGVDLEGMERAGNARAVAGSGAAREAEAAKPAADAAPGRRVPSAPRQAAASVRRPPSVRRDPAEPEGDWGEEAAPEASGGGEPYVPIPSTLGIRHTDYRDAAWGIVNAVTPYRSLADGEVLGNAGIGAVFEVGQRQPAAGGGVEFVGNFPNRPLEDPVVIPAARIYCFTGSYDSLTPGQKSALSAYYKKRAEAERLKRELIREIGSRSPYFEDAVEAKTKWDEMVRTAEELEVALRTDRNANASEIRDRLARMKGEMAVQKGKVKDLSARHKEWKEKNPAQVSDPDEDPRMQKLRAEMQGFAKAIPGLAF